MKAKKFKQQFVEGVDITASLDLSKVKLGLQEQQRVDMDSPTWRVDSLDREASKPRFARQSDNKVRLADRIEAIASNLLLRRTRAGATRLVDSAPPAKAAQPPTTDLRMSIPDSA